MTKNLVKNSKQNNFIIQSEVIELMSLSEIVIFQIKIWLKYVFCNQKPVDDRDSWKN